MEENLTAFENLHIFSLDFRCELEGRSLFGSTPHGYGFNSYLLPPSHKTSYGKVVPYTGFEKTKSELPKVKQVFKYMQIKDLS